MKIKLIAVVLLSIVTSGCITMCNVAECFDPVPYSGMFTTSYWGENYEIDGVKYVDTMEARFPIGFFGACNVYFWTIVSRVLTLGTRSGMTCLVGKREG